VKPKLAAVPPKDACVNCKFYLAPKQMPVNTAFKPPGYCRRFPATVAKEPGDYCGEYKGA
jgi:hypothetical protein